MLMAFSGTGKWQVRTGEDGNCIFSGPDKAVPSMPSSPMFAGHGRFPGEHGRCRKPPSGQGFCPGIRPDATHEEFVEEGQSYLEENGLVASDPEHEGHALLPVSKTDSSF